ncbi:hypothetical protein MTO96_008549 [Rhipicephalus appendiculatus]
MKINAPNKASSLHPTRRRTTKAYEVLAQPPAVAQGLRGDAGPTQAPDQVLEDGANPQASTCPGRRGAWSTTAEPDELACLRALRYIISLAMIIGAAVPKVIAAVLFIAAPGRCKIVRGTLKTSENWAFLTRFCFLSQQGHFIYEFAYPADYGPQNLLLYYDEKHQWPAVYKKPKSCSQKESVLSAANGQIVNLTDRFEWSKCDIVDEVYRCRDKRRFKSARERWWFIAISNCNASKGLYLEYMLELYNDDSNFWYKHFSADEFYILHTDIGAFFVYIILFVASCYGACVLFSRSYLHTTYKMFMVSVLCQLLSLLCLVTYYAMYADDGIGIPQLKLLGYTVTRGRLKPSTSAKIGTFMTLYVVVYTALFIYERQYFDPGEVLYIYESPAGYGIVALRLVGWGWFVYATVFTLLHYPEKTAFYTRLFLLYTVWLLSAPVIILIAAFVVPKWMREKVINVVELMVIFFAHIVFLVDVVQHPTIGVISENYIDRFPHHAYAPTESLVAEPPAGSIAAVTAVDYATLFGGATRHEHENNNWQQLRTMQRTSTESSFGRFLPRLSGQASGRSRSIAQIRLTIDFAGAESVPRYVLFVLFGATVMSAVLVVVPGALLLHRRPCGRLGGCYSLQRELVASIDYSVPPCDDFYRHVCGGWDRLYATMRGEPASWYEEVFMDTFLWKLMQRTIPRRPVRAMDKAASMLLHCVQEAGYHGGETLRDFLRDVGLSWPHKSTASRQQLLDSLVMLSLDVGMPTLWKFVVGRHPARPTENVLYMSLDRRYSLWSQDVDRLSARGAISRYLRRGAEFVGGLGGSYSVMIEDVLATHEDLTTFLQARARLSILHSWNTYTTVRYLNLSDAELRRAINGHLPDDSQLWTDDEVVDLHPGVFESIDEMYLRVDGQRERFKQFLGAYLVWTLSPFVSSQLDKAMIADMGRVDSAQARRSRECFETISHVMPLVSWKLQSDLVGDVRFVWGVFHSVVRALRHFIASYNEWMDARIAETTAQLKVNALNMSSTWTMLDRMYAFVPGGAKKGTCYFDRYRRIARAAASLHKQSLRAPRQNTYHLPGVSHEINYRLLVTREVPKYSSRHMEMALGQELHADTHRFRNAVRSYANHTTKTMTLTKRESNDILRSSLAMLSAVHAVEGHYEELTRDVWVPTTKSFPGVPASRLLFLLTCFRNCGASGRLRFLKKLLCNVGLPTVPSFPRAFQCRPGDPMRSNFTWREAIH